jgi:hypothetical protein
MMDICYDEEKGTWSECKSYTVINVATEEDFKALQDAVEKQKGRKCERVKLQEDIKIGNGTFRKGTSVCGKCPACESWVQIQDKYCRYCGQKLDWSDENE